MNWHNFLLFIGGSMTTIGLVIIIVTSESSSHTYRENKTLKYIVGNFLLGTGILCLAFVAGMR